MDTILLLGGMIVGAVAAWYLLRNQTRAGGDAMLMAEREKNKLILDQLTDAKRELDSERRKLLEVNSELASTDADYRNLQEKLSEQNAVFENMSERFTLQFKQLANDLFEEKSRKFTDQNKSNIFDLLKPLGEKIVDFERKVEETHKDNISRNSALREQLENLQRLNVQMTREAENLTRALRGDSKTQGA